MKTTSVRQKKLALIHVARRDLDLDEQRYRDILLEATGLDTCRELSLDELDRVLDCMRRLGWAPAPPRGRYSPASRQKKPGEKTQADKIRAMWISMHHAGVVRNPSEASLAKFCERLTGKHTPDWLDAHEATIVIQALTAWARNEHVEEAVGA